MQADWNNPVPWLVFGGIAAAIGVVVLIVALVDARRREIGPWRVALVVIVLLGLVVLFLGIAADEGVLSRLLAGYAPDAREAVTTNTQAAARVVLFGGSCLAIIIGLVGMLVSFAILGAFADGRLLRHEMVASRSYRELVNRRRELGRLGRAWLWAMHFVSSLMILGWGALLVSITLGFKPDIVLVAFGQILLALVLLITLPQFWDNRLARKLNREHPTGRGDTATP
jgi:hypothetical protein